MTARTLRLVESVSLLVALGCGGRAAPPATATAKPPTADTTAPPASPAGPLVRTPTDTATPTLTIVNDYPIAQHVFVDAGRLGEVAAGARATFVVPAGAHRLECADSAEQDSDPARVEVTFEPGFGYTYRLTGE